MLTTVLEWLLDIPSHIWSKFR